MVELLGYRLDPVPLGILAFVVVLLLWFVFSFIFGALRIERRLARARRRLSELAAKSANARVDPDKDVPEVLEDAQLRALWRQYRETLHDQEALVQGQLQIVSTRATVPAELYFSPQVLVETPLRTEFFKHLPGILTGIGIIGTFVGLLSGLKGFDPSNDPDKARESLGFLLQGVTEAFICSAIAIGAAMLTTFFEKRFLAGLFKDVEELCQIIDRMYRAGAGEEYLQRLVHASEQSASQTTQLKDNLVQDLRKILTELTDRQIAAQQANTQILSNQLVQSIQDGLKEPLQQISAVVEKASGQQGTAVQGMLQDILTAFMAKIEETFGTQLRGMNELMNRTIGSIQSMQDNMTTLVASIEQAGKSTAGAMGAQLEEAMKAAKLQQELMNESMRDFVGEIRALVGESQQQSEQKMRESLQAMQEALTGALNSIATQNEQIATANRARHDEFHQATQSAVGALSSDIATLVGKTGEAVTLLQQSVTALERTTLDAINRLNSGAETMYVAASEFTKSSGQVNETLQRTEEVSRRLATVGADLAAAGSTLQDAVTGYTAARDAISQMVGSLETIVETAKQDAGVNRELVEQMQEAATTLRTAQSEAKQYLEVLNGVIQESFEDFGDAVKKSLDKARGNFDTSLSEATTMLKEVIEDLAEKLEPQ